MGRRPKQRLTLRLPYPPRELLPNNARRQHWGDRARAAADLRERTAYETRQQIASLDLRLPFEYVDVTLQWFAPDMRFGDRDGLLSASKAVLDALQPPSDKPGAGVIRDDTDKGVRHILLLPTECDRDDPRVEVHIKEA